MTRRERLIAIAKDSYGLETEPRDHYDSAGEEDLAEYLHGEQEIQRFALITFGGADGAFFYADYPTRVAAEADAFKNVLDDIFSEVPGRIVDLDTGESWYPTDFRATWKPVSQNESAA